MNNQSRTQTRATALIVRAWRPSALAILVIAAAILLLIPDGLRVVHAQTPANNDATGRPVVLVSAEGAGILFSRHWSIADGNGLPMYPFNEGQAGAGILGHLRLVLPVDPGRRRDRDQYRRRLARYQLVEADFGKLIKVKVSFTDGDNFSETVTSLPFGPIAEPAPLRRQVTLVGNTGQSPSATANDHPATTPWASGWGITARATRSPASRSTWPRSRPV